MERVTTRGRPKGSRGRGKGKRGRKATKHIVSDEEENHTEIGVASKEQEDPVTNNNVNVNQEDPEELISATETKSPAPEITEGDVSISEADHEDEVKKNENVEIQ